MNLLPFEQKTPFDHWILKIHGDLEHEDDILMSRSAFVGYTSSSGPSGAIVHALMLTRHLLVVRTSMRDVNFLQGVASAESCAKTSITAGPYPANSRSGSRTVSRMTRQRCGALCFEAPFERMSVSK